MKSMKSLLILALLVVPFAMHLNAQTLQANVAGSSALWVEMGQGIYGLGSATPNCAWTDSSAAVQDSRIASPNTESGKLWVVWTPGLTGTCAAPASDSLVYAFISLDSTVGNRCLFAQPSCTLGTSKPAGNAGGNLLAGITDTALPASVLAAFNSQPVTVAATDVLPVDAKFATWQTLSPCGSLAGTMTTSTGQTVQASQFSGLGYGPGPVGSAIKSAMSSALFNVVDFNVAGNDPITGTPVPAYTVTPVGASPVLVIVNTSNQSGFGSGLVKNITPITLAGYLSGFLGRTADVIPQAFAGTGASYYGTTSFLREPLSGTYRTMEHSILNTINIHRSQEYGNCIVYNPPTNNVVSNPLNLTKSVGGTSFYLKRVIGTGQMVSSVSSTTDSIGYAFWSAGNFANKTNLKYLTVNGVDPLFDSYSNGAIPTAAGALMDSVTLSNVKNGNYPIWSMLRLVSTSTQGTNAAQALATAAQNMVSFGAGAIQPDFIPYNQMTVFHAHYIPMGTASFSYGPAASDGVCGAGAPPEAGGDAGGMVFTMQAGADYCVLKGNYNAAGGVGPTNTAAFGVRQ